jgi:acyl-coenzyme A synthetase/AMP-(fatty) acid ligase
VSAGEALPEDVGRRWSERYGVDILDGLGSTEMLHIFLSNRIGDLRYGTTGKPVPGGVKQKGQERHTSKGGAAHQESLLAAFGFLTAAKPEADELRSIGAGRCERTAANP